MMMMMIHTFKYFIYQVNNKCEEEEEEEEEEGDEWSRSNDYTASSRGITHRVSYFWK